MVTDYRAIMIAVLRGQTYATIQESFRCSSKTIRCVKRVVEDHGLTESDVQGLDAERLAGLFPDRRFERDASYAEIDTAALIRRKRIFAAKNPGRKFKIKVEHERYERECLSKGLKPYSYKQYAARVADYISDKNLSWPMTHDPGHKMFVDWSGDKMWVGQPGDTDAFQVSVFVATLPHSGMVFAKCYANERTPNWIAAHVDACNYFGGVPVLFVPDNASTASFRPKKEDPAREINTAYRQFGDYYGAGILPTKPAQPTHKGHVEKHVDIIQDWLGQYLAPYVFDTLDDLNVAVAEQVDWINHHKTPYRGVDGLTRYQEFCDYERN